MAALSPSVSEEDMEVAVTGELLILLALFTTRAVLWGGPP